MGNHYIRLNGKANGCSLAFLGPDPNMSAVGFYDCLAEVQPQPRTTNLRLGAVAAIKLLKQVGHNTLGYTYTRILDNSFYNPVFSQSRLNVYFLAAAAVLDGIIQKIAQNFVDTDTVHARHRQVWREAVLDGFVVDLRAQ